MTFLCWLLLWLKVVLGLRINLDERVNTCGRVENTDDLALESGFKVVNLQSTYLGLPLGALSKVATVWGNAEVGWLCGNDNTYPKEGVTLIQSTLFNMLTYFMSLLRMPSSIRKMLEQIQRDFL